jgi:hypothetical protein
MRRNEDHRYGSQCFRCIVFLFLVSRKRVRQVSMCSVDFVLFDFVFSCLHNAIVVIQFFVRDTTTVQGSYQASDPVYPAPCPSINTTAAIPPSRRHPRRPSSILP